MIGSAGQSRHIPSTFEAEALMEQSQESCNALQQRRAGGAHRKHTLALRVLRASDNWQPRYQLVQVNEAVAIAVQLSKGQVHPAGPQLIFLQLGTASK